MVAVKICGVRTAEVAALCSELLVDFAGLNFVPTSRRYLPLDGAKAVRAALGAIPTVGVFRDAPQRDVLHTIDALELPWIQLHGGESPDSCAQLRARGVRVIKAMPMGETIISDIAQYRDAADVVLLDAPLPGGGTPWSWDSFVSHRSQIVDGISPPIFVAGGLTPDNVTAAIAAIAPAGVDVASGVESCGVIDPAKVRAFCSAVRSLLPV